MTIKPALKAQWTLKIDAGSLDHSMQVGKLPGLLQQIETDGLPALGIGRPDTHRSQAASVDSQAVTHFKISSRVRGMDHQVDALMGAGDIGHPPRFGYDPSKHDHKVAKAETLRKLLFAL
jgi:hypothetical protein